MIDTSAIARQREYFETGVTLPVAFRKTMLRRLLAGLDEREAELLEALRLDLGKCAFEGYETELAIVREEIRYQLGHLSRWTRPVRVKTPLVHFPSRSRVYAEPLGVVLVMSPWNYPVQLALAPLADALAAGNCAAVKPSRYAFHSAEAVKRLLEDVFPPEYVSVFLGGHEVNTQLLETRFDHIFFTGSQAVGKVVMEKAAAFLTPVTLELGGKSPCIVDATANVPLAARRIAWGKCLNSGQTCVAPDYLMAHESVADELAEAIKAEFAAMYGDALENPEYGKIINEKHFARLSSLLSDGRVLCGGGTDAQKLKIQPTLIADVPENSRLLTDEIFGPILPVLRYTRLSEATERIKSGGKPLALYLFSRDRGTISRVIREIPFGGGCINDTVIHLTNPNMRFGGVGESGMGGYHGKTGFLTFSHVKPVLFKGKADVRFRYAPYGKRLPTLKKLMR